MPSLPHGEVDEVRLRLWRPNGSAWARAVAKPRTIEGNDAMRLRRHLDETARREILNHAAIAVQQNERFTRAPIDVVKLDVAYVHKFSRRRVFALGFFRERSVDQRRNAERCSRSCDRQRILRQSSEPGWNGGDV